MTEDKHDVGESQVWSKGETRCVSDAQGYLHAPPVACLNLRRVSMDVQRTPLDNGT